MKLSRSVLWVVCFGVTACLVTPVTAFDQPAVNLGFTSFLDGGPPAGPGFYFTEYLQYYTADELPDHASPNADVDTFVSLNQFIYQSDQPVFLGGKWGMDVIVPIVSIDSTDSTGAVTDNGGGFGDILVGPYLQWDPVMGDNGPVFMHRIEFQTLWPTGDYSNAKGLTQSSHFFSFNPYWAGTYFISPKLTTSWRVHYLWNDKNNDPFVGFGASDTQAGQAIHANFAAAYEVMPKKLRLGVNGYYLKQISDSKMNGASVSGREMVFAVGPGAIVSFSQDTHLFFNAYHETSVSYRPKGDKLVLRLVKHFR